MELVTNATTKDADWEEDATITFNEKYRRDDMTKTIESSSDHWKESHATSRKENV